MQAATMAASSARRLAKVAAFNVAFWASSGTRSQYKALRPLPGETFEFLDRDLGILMLGENVCIFMHYQSDFALLRSDL